ncbi:MAG: GspH/FimT family pseudopilin [Magnetococcales bacterium]|nr:GspH/FimT family pseudopilin [Magnetococcales bacterium]
MTTHGASGGKRGFTLVEMLISLAIVAILVTLGLPYMQDMVLNQQVKNAISDLQFSLLHARSEAIKRNANVSVIPTGGNWQNGWTVQFGATVLKTQDAYAKLTITGQAGSITYQRSGRLTATAADFKVHVNGNIRVAMRCLVIGANGTPHTQIDTDADPTNGCTL